ncbi:hypothetical protein [Chromohalobacter israelensis]|uniref:hypothetical protein n=1 Tax=Chromohalobacter israelensis TaxID=141390 RepID=UPI0015C498AC|nr:hypothetical protein [Chromohalobacter salexigens]
MGWLDEIIADKSLFIAFCAMAATMLSSILALIGVVFTNRHNKLSVAPMVTVSVGVNGDVNEFVFTVENEGLGPALIKNLEVYVEEVGFDATKIDSVNSFVERLCDGVENESGHFIAHTMSMGPGTILGAGKSANLIRIAGEGVEKVKEKNKSLLGVRMVYVDSYKTSWVKTVGSKEEAYKKRLLSFKYWWLQVIRHKAPIGL